MASPTPGPWAIEERDKVSSGGRESRFVGPFIVIADGAAVATIEDDGAYGEAEANARLIAAAPDLLEVLHKLVRAIDTDPATINLVSREAWLSIARAAIARAEGVSS